MNERGFSWNGDSIELVPEGVFVMGLPEGSPQVLNVTHIYDNEGMYSCDQVAITDRCLYDGDCMPTNRCPSKDGKYLDEEDPVSNWEYHHYSPFVQINRYMNRIEEQARALEEANYFKGLNEENLAKVQGAEQDAKRQQEL
jgi:hypothetical protein